MDVPPARSEQIESERSGARAAGICAILAALLFAASIWIQQAGLEATDGTAEDLVQASEHSGQLLAGSILGGIAFALLAYPLYFLFRAAEERSDQVKGALIAFAFIGPILFGAAQIAQGVGIDQAADDFIARDAEERPSDTATGDDEDSPREELADDVIGETGVLTFGAALRVPALFGFGIGLVYIPLWAMRTGLLTRFWATLGMALGVTSVLFPPLGILGSIIWFVAVGLQIAGWWPGPRPPAWETGAAVPWPKPGDPSPGEAPAETAPYDVDDAVEGSGREVSGPPPRKRKRRNRGQS